MSALSRELLLRHKAQEWNSAPSSSGDQVIRFHHALPNYKPTPLISLDEVAKNVGVRSVLLKDESERLGLPSFKILGASWGTFRAVASKLLVPCDSDIDSLRQAATKSNITLYAATDGNHGRAVAWMGRLLKLPAQIHVPAVTDLSTIELIESEGARVVVSRGDYNEAIQEAYNASKSDGGILVQDHAFDDYREIPQWIVQGYHTMMHEIEDQLQGQSVTLIFAPVGVGSFAQSVISHFRRPGSFTSVVLVEPDTAACVRKSLECDTLTSISTTPTTMAGLNCGTPSLNAWPILRDGARGSMTVSDFEAHEASQYLESIGIYAGPCGASPLAALRRLSDSDKVQLGLDHDSVVMLPSTEGMRDYTTPLGYND